MFPLLYGLGCRERDNPTQLHQQWQLHNIWHTFGVISLIQYHCNIRTLQRLCWVSYAQDVWKKLKRYQLVYLKTCLAWLCVHNSFHRMTSTSITFTHSPTKPLLILSSTLVENEQMRTNRYWCFHTSHLHTCIPGPKAHPHTTCIITWTQTHTSYTRHGLLVGVQR